MSKWRSRHEKWRQARKRIDCGRARRWGCWFDKGGESTLKRLFAEGKFPGYVAGESLSDYLLRFDADQLMANFEDPGSLLEFAVQGVRPFFRQ